MAGPDTLTGWSRPGAAADQFRWNLDSRSGWVPPGQSSPKDGTQYSMPATFDPVAAPGYTTEISKPGKMAPTNRINYDIDLKRLFMPGETAPPDNTQITLMPQPAPAPTIGPDDAISPEDIMRMIAASPTVGTGADWNPVGDFADMARERLGSAWNRITSPQTVIDPALGVLDAASIPLEPLNAGMRYATGSLIQAGNQAVNGQEATSYSPDDVMRTYEEQVPTWGKVVLDLATPVPPVEKIAKLGKFGKVSEKLGGFGLDAADHMDDAVEAAPWDMANMTNARKMDVVDNPTRFENAVGDLDKAWWLDRTSGVPGEADEAMLPVLREAFPNMKDDELRSILQDSRPVREMPGSWQGMDPPRRTHFPEPLPQEVSGTMTSPVDGLEEIPWRPDQEWRQGATPGSDLLDRPGNPVDYNGNIAAPDAAALAESRQSRQGQAEDDLKRALGDYSTSGKAKATRAREQASDFQRGMLFPKASYGSADGTKILLTPRQIREMAQREPEFAVDKLGGLIDAMIEPGDPAWDSLFERVVKAVRDDQPIVFDLAQGRIVPIRPQDIKPGEEFPLDGWGVQLSYGRGNKHIEPFNGSLHPDDLALGENARKGFAASEAEAQRAHEQLRAAGEPADVQDAMNARGHFAGEKGRASMIVLTPKNVNDAWEFFKADAGAQREKAAGYRKWGNPKADAVEKQIVAPADAFLTWLKNSTGMSDEEIKRVGPMVMRQGHTVVIRDTPVYQGTSNLTENQRTTYLTRPKTIRTLSEDLKVEGRTRESEPQEATVLRLDPKYGGAWGPDYMADVHPESWQNAEPALSNAFPTRKKTEPWTNEKGVDLHYNKEAAEVASARRNERQPQSLGNAYTFPNDNVGPFLQPSVHKSNIGEAVPREDMETPPWLTPESAADRVTRREIEQPLTNDTEGPLGGKWIWGEPEFGPFADWFANDPKMASVFDQIALRLAQARAAYDKESERERTRQEARR